MYEFHEPGMNKTESLPSQSFGKQAVDEGWHPVSRPCKTVQGQSRPEEKLSSKVRHWARVHGGSARNEEFCSVVVGIRTRTVSIRVIWWLDLCFGLWEELHHR